MRTAVIGRAAATAALVIATAFGLTGCAGGGSGGEGGTPAAVEGAEPTQASQVSIRDAWVKAADDGMSAAFGVLVNSSDQDVRVVSSTCDASPVMELHETVENADGQMVMREKDGGFLIPAGSEYVLQPGANHLMLMDIVAPVLAGGTVSFALEFEDGSVFEFDATAKDYAGANETYVSE